MKQVSLRFNAKLNDLLPTAKHASLKDMIESLLQARADTIWTMAHVEGVANVPGGRRAEMEGWEFYRLPIVRLILQQNEGRHLILHVQ